eukprot:6149910-Prorocentrum_lima.AAC.1
MSSVLGAKDCDGDTLLHDAACNGHVSCVQALLSHASGPEQKSIMLAARNNSGKTAMEVAKKN